MTNFALSGASPATSRADAVVVGVLTKPGRGSAGSAPVLAPGSEDVAKAYGRKLAPLLSSLGVTGKVGETVKVPTGGTVRTPVLVLVGLGSDVDTRSVRRAAGAAARAVTNAASVALALPADSPELVSAAVEGYLLGGYTFDAYKPAEGANQPPAEVALLGPGARKKSHATALAEAQVVAAAVATTRDWVNRAPNDLTPPVFADAVSTAVSDAAGGRRGRRKVSVTVRDEVELRELGCGGLLAVGGSSAAPPRLVELRYAPRGAKRHLALVGKGITFDSGGYTLKPAAGMGEMKSDMAGAATVVQATLAIAALELPLAVTTYAALAENMVSGAAMRPGDVITMLDGTTVEISNTDAEGRLVLADALHLASQLDPDVVLDVATLTGHMVVALGDKVAGVMGDDDVVRDVLAASDHVDEDMWPMPIPEAMDERIRSSKIADLSQHDWIRWGGGLFAAAFLREFTGGRPWGHLDIAGPAFNSGGPSGHWTSGGTGVAVATLVEYARRLADS